MRSLPYPRPAAVLLLLLVLACAGEPAHAPEPATVKVAAIQCPSRMGDVEGNRRRIVRLVTEAAENGAKIVVLPEAAITGYLSQDLKRTWRLPGRPIDPFFEGVDPSAAAETVPGESTRELSARARRLGIWLTIPLVERVGEGEARRYYNTVCLASPSGELALHYRKLNPWPVPEQSWATDGDRGIQVCETEYGRVGLAICYDIHTIPDRYEPENLWALLYPIAWVDMRDPSAWFDGILPDRLAEYDHHLIGANWSVEAEQEWLGYGCSLVIERGGRVAARASTRVGEEIVCATLPTARTESVGE